MRKHWLLVPLPFVFAACGSSSSGDSPNAVIETGYLNCRPSPECPGTAVLCEDAEGNETCVELPTACAGEVSCACLAETVCGDVECQEDAGGIMCVAPATDGGDADVEDAGGGDTDGVDTGDADVGTPNNPATLGPIGAPAQAFFVRVDGGRFTNETGPRIAPGPDGGFLAAAAVRDEGLDNRDLWVGRFDAGGAPVWHFIEEATAGTSIRATDLVTFGSRAAVLSMTMLKERPSPLQIQILDVANGAVITSKSCSSAMFETCFDAIMAASPDGNLHIVGPSSGGQLGSPPSWAIVQRVSDEGEGEEFTALEGAGRLVDFEIAPDGRWIAAVAPGEQDSADPSTIEAFETDGTRLWQVEVDSIRALAVGLDGRIAVAGHSGPVDEPKAAGLVLSGAGETLFALPNVGTMHAAVAFAPGGDLYLATSELSEVGGDLPGTAGKLEAIRRTRIDREGTVRWSEQRRVLPHHLNAAPEAATGLLADANGVFIASSGPSGQMRDMDAVIERLEWTDPLPAAPAGPVMLLDPTDVKLANPPAVHGPAGGLVCPADTACPVGCVELCGVPVRIDAPPAPSGFAATPEPAVWGTPGANWFSIANVLWLRTDTLGPWTTRWSTEGWSTEEGVAPAGDYVVLRDGESQVVVADVTNPAAPIERACIPAPAGLGIAPAALGERWMAARTFAAPFKMTSDPAPELLVFDLAAADPASSGRSLGFLRENVVIDGDRLFVAGKLFDLAQNPPALIAQHPEGGSYHQAFGIAGFVLGGALALDMRSDTLEGYTVDEENCGYRFVGSGVSVMKGGSERLAGDADLSCSELHWGAVVAEPNGPRVAVLDWMDLVIRNGDTIERTIDVGPNGAGMVEWIGSRLLIHGGSEACFPVGCTIELRSPDTGEKTGEVMEPAHILERASDGNASFWLAYLDGNYSGGSPIPPLPTERQILRLDPEDGTLTPLALSEYLEPLALAASPGRLYLTTRQSEVYRLDENGTVLASMYVPELDGSDASEKELLESKALSVTDMGLFIQTERGRLIWLSEDLTTIRSTESCLSSFPLANIGATLIAQRPFPSAAFWSSPVIEAWEVVPSGEDGFEVDITGSFSSPGPLSMSAGPDRLWVGSANVFALLPP